MQLLKQISGLETQQNNFLAANGGYVSTENLPILSGYQEKIAELRKQLETTSQPAGGTDAGERICDVGRCVCGQRV